MIWTGSPECRHRDKSMVPMQGRLRGTAARTEDLLCAYSSSSPPGGFWPQGTFDNVGRQFFGCHPWYGYSWFPVRWVQ